MDRMRAVPESAKYTVADDTCYPAGFHCPNPRGWYHSVAGIVDTDDGLVAVYRLSDSHTALYTHIMVAYSHDQGKTWSGHHSIAHRNVWEHHGCWVAPQLSKLRDGRLVIICDLGHRASGNDWPMLTIWQKRPPRGMANYLFWSSDNGKTWSEPVQIDDVGGEPSYILELSNGTLLYTRTEPLPSDKIKDGPLPWGNIYYRNVAVFSDDGGKTWGRTSIVTDDPYHGDFEVSIEELEDGHVIAATRVGFGGGAFGQPSRIVHSYDYGKTWGQPILTPFYGQRPILRKLQSGNLLVTYRNRWGTYASYAHVFRPDEKLAFQPNSFIWEEERCTLQEGFMTLTTGLGLGTEVWFSLYPTLDSSSSVELQAELRVETSDDDGGAVLNAGCAVCISKGCVFLLARKGSPVDATGASPGDSLRTYSDEIGFANDASLWKKYTVVRKEGTLLVYVDGDLKLTAPIAGMEQRPVRFGGLGNAVTHWRTAAGKVMNLDGPSIDWAWKASEGYPDQFRRDRMVRLDYTSDSGYSGWTQLQDGTIVIVDYTNDSFRSATWGLGPQPIVRAYVVKEADLA